MSTRREKSQTFKECRYYLILTNDLEYGAVVSHQSSFRMRDYAGQIGR